MIVNFLFESLLVDDDLVAVDEVLFEIMRKHTFEGRYFIRIANFLDGIGNLIVEVSWFDQSQSSLGSLVCSKDNICFFASDWCFSVGLDNNSVGSEGSEAINVGSDLNFDEIALFDRG